MKREKKGFLKDYKSKDVLSFLTGEDVISPGTALCPGCTSELALRFALKIFGKNTCLFTAPGCGSLMTVGDGINASMKVPSALCLMTNVPSMMSGAKRYFNRLGKNINCVAFVGDGTTADVGFQPLSGAAERGEEIIYICNDNEGYMNTGIQRSGTTPLHAWTFTSPVGKSWQGKAKVSKNLPLIMLMHGIAYVATASMAFPKDFAEKVSKAKAVSGGMSYIHMINPCPTGWRSRPELSIELSRLLVETNYFPLWEAEGGRIRMTKTIEAPKPIEAFTRLQGRFEHMNKIGLKKFQEEVDNRYEQLIHLSKFHKISQPEDHANEK